MVTYDSGADGHYRSKEDRKHIGLPILKKSSKKVRVANGGTSKAKYVTCLPFHNILPRAATADSFDDFPTSLMSVA
jgi:hypothetical protein